MCPLKKLLIEIRGDADGQKTIFFRRNSRYCHETDRRGSPVGSSEVDGNRFDNILLLMNVVDILIDEIQLQVPCQNDYDASVKKIGLKAVEWVMEKKEYFDNYFDD